MIKTALLYSSLLVGTVYWDRTKLERRKPSIWWAALSRRSSESEVGPVAA